MVAWILLEALSHIWVVIYRGATTTAVEEKLTYIAIVSLFLPNSTFGLRRGQDITSQLVSRVSGPNGCRPRLQSPICTPYVEVLQRQPWDREGQRTNGRSSELLSLA